MRRTEPDLKDVAERGDELEAQQEEAGMSHCKAVSEGSVCTHLWSLPYLTLFPASKFLLTFALSTCIFVHYHLCCLESFPCTAGCWLFFLLFKSYLCCILKGLLRQFFIVYIVFSLETLLSFACCHAQSCTGLCIIWKSNSVWWQNGGSKGHSARQG